MIADRGPALPALAAPYRTIGPFDSDTIPAGLLRRHDLKPGVWGVLTVAFGTIRFCWDDEAGGERELAAGGRSSSRRACHTISNAAVR